MRGFVLLLSLLGLTTSKALAGKPVGIPTFSTVNRAILIDRDGVSIIVDQRGDDYSTEPLGSAGALNACGVVIHTQELLSRPPITAKAR